MPAPATEACLASDPLRMEEGGGGGPPACRLWWRCRMDRWWRRSAASILSTRSNSTGFACRLPAPRMIAATPGRCAEDRLLQATQRGLDAHRRRSDGRATPTGEPHAPVALPVPQAGWRPLQDPRPVEACADPGQGPPRPQRDPPSQAPAVVGQRGATAIARVGGRGGNAPLLSTSRTSSKLLTRRQLARIDRLTAGRRDGRTRHGRAARRGSLPGGRPRHAACRSFPCATTTPCAACAVSPRSRDGQARASSSRLAAHKRLQDARRTAVQHARCASRSRTRACPSARRRPPPCGAP